jgi:hypothetical protein
MNTFKRWVASIVGRFADSRHHKRGKTVDATLPLVYLEAVKQCGENQEDFRIPKIMTAKLIRAFPDITPTFLMASATHYFQQKLQK